MKKPFFTQKHQILDLELVKSVYLDKDHNVIVDNVDTLFCIASFESREQAQEYVSELFKTFCKLSENVW